MTSRSYSISHPSYSSVFPLLFRSTKISKQTRSGNMSDHSSTDNTSSTTAASSSLHTAVQPSRPALARSESYTHVFPASRAPSKPRPSTTRKADAPFVAAPTHVQDDKTRLLFGGLHWLLDTSVKSHDSNSARFTRESSEPLSDKAITSFNARKDANTGKSLKPTETAAWIDGQRKSPAAPPF